MRINSQRTRACARQTVKNITNCNRFFVSDNEWRASRGLSNYWLYLVDLSEKSRPVIEMVPASALAESHLCPNQYRVRFSRVRFSRKAR